jgi:spermidine synthase
MLLVFALTLFGSATLLFMVEPMVGKMMLPLLGGTPAVWNTCMVFFQAVLLAGYAYAHATTAWLGARKQALLHLAVLVVPFVFFLIHGPLAVNKEMIAGHEDNPIPVLLLVLTLTVGLPLFVVSTTAPLLQHWFASTDHPSARDPYFLYGASNLGSMLALIGYPVLVEPHLKLAEQRFDWAVGYGVLVALVGACAAYLWLSPPAPATPAEKQKENAATAPPPSQGVTRDNPGAVSGKRGKGRDGRKGKAAPAPAAVAPEVSPLHTPVTWPRRLRWVALAAVPSSLMLGVTTYITTDIAAISFLWVLPLGLYLLSFIIVFGKVSLPAQRVAVWVLPAVFMAAAAALAGFVLRAPEQRTTWDVLAWGVVIVAGGGVMLLGAYMSQAGSSNLGEGLLQRYTVWLLVVGLLLGLVFLAAPAITDNLFVLWPVRAGAVVAFWFSLKIFQARDRSPLHSAMVLALPLIVLLITFLMLSELQAGITYTILLHLGALFVVAMVCHGELARDRPDPKHLTEFFLWMSVGGVLGGLFNALAAPLLFNSLVEYPLAMVAACLLLPAFGAAAKESSWGRTADVAMAALFVAVGVALFLVRLPDKDVTFKPLATPAWLWGLAAAALPAAALAFLALRAREKRVERWLDLALPLALAVLAFGLNFGITSDRLWPQVKGLALRVHMKPTTLSAMLIYGLPAVLCYTFIERSVRFGLGLGALLLALGMCSTMEYSPLFQQRSFFGVMKVEEGNERAGGRLLHFHRLVHGTTVHGKQFTDEDMRHEPISYYDETGPVGHFCQAYNTDARRNMAVIGLGTGTMAAWARPGQRLTFYDIDPVVRDISFTRDDLFSFVEDARDNGVQIDLVLGDARLTMERKQLSEAEKYGLLVVDAFSSDAIPIHLLTLESVRMYLSKMTEDGLLVFHISNRHLDLEPVLANIIEAEGLAGVVESDNDEDAPGKSTSTWVVIARKPEYLARLITTERWKEVQKRWKDTLLPACAWPAGGTGLTAQAMFTYGIIAQVQPPGWRPLQPDPKVGVWTDDYSNLLSVFRWGIGRH